jgi:hypothetical protein
MCRFFFLYKELSKIKMTSDGSAILPGMFYECTASVLLAVKNIKHSGTTT